MRNNPDILWLNDEAIRIAIEDNYEGEGTDWIKGEYHRRRVEQLLEANNRYLERARAAEVKLVKQFGEKDAEIPKRKGRRI